MADISRAEAAALIPRSDVQEIFKLVPEYSQTMRLMRRLPDMSTQQYRIPVLSVLPQADFVSEGGTKATTEQQWTTRDLIAEEIACIVPIHENVIADAFYDIWAEVRPEIAAAIGRTFDAAILHGTNKPSSWPTDVVAAAAAAGNTVSAAGGGDAFDQIMGDGGVLSLLEADGFMATGHLAVPGFRGQLRGLRDGTTGVPIFMQTLQGATNYALDGSPLFFAMNGAMDATKALMISAQWDQMVYALRQDITFKVLDQATLTDGSGTVLFNLAQQDMVALRVVMRVAWQVPNPVSPLQPTAGNRYPAATLTP